MPPTSEYEPLEGGTGKEINYRQERYLIAELLNGNSDVQHSANFSTYSGTIVDFGINGVAFSINSHAPTKDDLLEDLRIVIGHDCVYQGRALVRYCRRDSSTKYTVGVVLLDGILDADAIVMAINRALATKTATALSRALEAGVSQKYKEAMADLVLLLSSYRQLLDSQEHSIESLSAPAARERAAKEMLEIAIAQFGEQYGSYRRLCNSLITGLTGNLKTAYRQYTEAVLHPHVMSAPDVYEAYQKPLGYPGDYLLMLYLYDPVPYGNSLYDKLVHEVVVRQEPMAGGVRLRKDFILGHIRRLSHEHVGGPDAPLRVLSLACGPAQEIIEFASEYRSGTSPVVFTLIDQDQRSLTHVNSSLSRILLPGQSNIKIKYLYMGFKQMIAQADALENVPSQDLIYAAGLFDYIRTITGRKLVKRLFSRLKKGGTMIIGNFKSPNDATWGLEYLVDWHLLYRTTQDMHDLAADIQEPHETEITCDASGYTNMLLVTRR